MVHHPNRLPRQFKFVRVWVLNTTEPYSGYMSIACLFMLVLDWLWVYFYICSDSEFLQIEHLDKLGLAHGTSEITYYNYLTLLYTTAFQLDLKRPKCSKHHTEVNSTNSTPIKSKSSSHGGCGHSPHNKCGGCSEDNKSNADPNQMPILISFSYPTNCGTPYQHQSFSISQHNQQYNVDATEQDNAGHIPKALWEQLPSHAKSAIANSQCHNKQEANSTTAHSIDLTDHPIANTLPMYTFNSVLIHLQT